MERRERRFSAGICCLVVTRGFSMNQRKNSNKGFNSMEKGTCSTAHLTRVGLCTDGYGNSMLKFVLTVPTLPEGEFVECERQKCRNEIEGG